MKIPGSHLQMASNECTPMHPSFRSCMDKIMSTDGQSNKSPHLRLRGGGYNELSAVLIIYDFQFLKVCTEQNSVVFSFQ